MSDDRSYVRWLENLTNDDVPVVGGKNASLGEMVQRLKEEGVRVPDGFATTAQGYREFLRANQLEDRLKEEIDKLNGEQQMLEQTGKAIRTLFRQAQFPEGIAEAIRKAYRELSRRNDVGEVAVAVRSSATAEDLPEASFAGQQETFLNVAGEHDLLNACRRC